MPFFTLLGTTWSENAIAAATAVVTTDAASALAASILATSFAPYSASIVPTNNATILSASTTAITAAAFPAAVTAVASRTAPFATAVTATTVTATLDPVTTRHAALLPSAPASCHTATSTAAVLTSQAATLSATRCSAVSTTIMPTSPATRPAAFLAALHTAVTAGPTFASSATVVPADGALCEHRGLVRGYEECRRAHRRRRLGGLPATVLADHPGRQRARFLAIWPLRGLLCEPCASRGTPLLHVGRVWLSRPWRGWAPIPHVLCGGRSGRAFDS